MSLSMTKIEFFNAEELAKLLNLDEGVLPNLRLARYSFAGHIRYSYADIAAFLKANRIEPPKSTKRIDFSKKHRHLELVPDAAEEPDAPPPPPPSAA